MNQRISQETKDQIREAIFADDDKALELLDHCEAVDKMAGLMLDQLMYYADKGTLPNDSGSVKELVMTLGPVLRVKDELVRQLRYLSRPPRSENNAKEHEEDQRQSGRESNLKVTNSRLRAAKYAKNRQHKNRASKRHEDVSSESSDHNS